jgi:thiamine transport system substrate-binding protein
MKKKIFVVCLLIMLGLFVLSGCAETQTHDLETIAETAAEPVKLTVMTHDSFAVSEDVVAAFETENNVSVEFVKSGDTGAALNRAILTKDAPIADVFYGVDNTFLSRALDADIFLSYDTPMLANIPDEFKLDANNGALPMDYGDVCINYDKAYFEENGLALPQTLDDLTKDAYKGLLVVENPVTSSPGLAFMLATIAEYGEDFGTYWEALKANDVIVVSDWETAYYTNFSGSSGRGEQPMAVSYGTSPAAEVIYAETELSDAPTASLVGKNMCFRQIEFIGILKGTQNLELAQKFIDFALDTPMQEDMPLQMFVYPVNQNAVLPEAFELYTQSPEVPASLDAAMVTENRENWLETWDSIMLR